MNTDRKILLLLRSYFTHKSHVS